MGEMVTIPIEEYRSLREAAEDLQDLRAFDRASNALARGDEELVPAEVAYRLIAGETALRVWREHRGMTQTSLALKAGVNRVQIANIESGKATGSVATLARLAQALALSMDDLVD